MINPCLKDGFYGAVDIGHVAGILKSGGIAIYPTETFYALGCLASNSCAAEEIRRLKRRPAGKPLSLLAASSRIAGHAVYLQACPKALLEKFWPGPLTLALPARSDLAPLAVDENGKTAIRVSPHPLAACLSALCGEALIATSANISGCAPAAVAERLDKELLDDLANSALPHAALIAGMEKKEAVLPSTIVEPVRQGWNAWQIRIIRQGAIDKKLLGGKYL